MVNATHEQCQATKRNGAACAAAPLPGSHYCFGHDPAKAAERADARRRGGYGRSTATRASKHLPPHLKDAEVRLVRLLDLVEQGAVPPRTAEVVGVLVSRLVELAKFAVDLGEQRELNERLTELEGQLAELGERKGAAA